MAKSKRVVVGGVKKICSENMESQVSFVPKIIKKSLPVKLAEIDFFEFWIVLGKTGTIL